MPRLLPLSAISCVVLGVLALGAGCQKGPEHADLQQYVTNAMPTIRGQLDQMEAVEKEIARAFGMAASTSLEQVQGLYLPALDTFDKALADIQPTSEPVKAIHARFTKGVELRKKAAKALEEGLSSSEDAGRDIPDEIRSAYNAAMQESDRELAIAKGDLEELAGKLGIELPK
jgi:DnaJ-domain-containing protein 1